MACAKCLASSANNHDDLAAKIEEARVSPKRRALKGAALETYIKEFNAGGAVNAYKISPAHLRTKRGVECYDSPVLARLTAS